jgi:hypothetical protein
VPQSLNRYTYVLGNPLALVDPRGLSGESTGVKNLADCAVREAVLDCGFGAGGDVDDEYWRPPADDFFTPSWELPGFEEGEDGGEFGGAGGSGNFGNPNGGLPTGGPSDPAAGNTTIYEEGFDWLRAFNLSMQGYFAFQDGAWPLVNPYESLGFYEADDIGMAEAQTIGSWTRDGMAAALTAGASLETSAGARMGGSWLTNNVFRWGTTGSAYGRTHFHLGFGSQSLMRHHLPQQFRTWQNHARALVGRWFSGR